MTDPLMERARVLGLHGLVAHWDDIGETGRLAGTLHSRLTGYPSDSKITPHGARPSLDGRADSRR